MQQNITYTRYVQLLFIIILFIFQGCSSVAKRTYYYKPNENKAIVENINNTSYYVADSKLYRTGMSIVKSNQYFLVSIEMKNKSNVAIESTNYSVSLFNGKKMEQLKLIDRKTSDLLSDESKQFDFSQINSQETKTGVLLYQVATVEEEPITLLVRINNNIGMYEFFKNK